MQKISTLCLLSFICLTSAQISIAPSTINFGDVQISQTVEEVVSVTNDGNEPVTMSGVGGGVYEPFFALQNCQGNLLNPGQACNMTYYFTADTTGTFSTFSNGTWNNYPFNISLTTNAVLPNLKIAPTFLDFGVVSVGESVKKTVYITNAGDAYITLSGVGGGLEAPFSVTQNCQDMILAPGARCEMIFTFSPKTTVGAIATSSGTWNHLPYHIKLVGNTHGIIA